MFAIGIRYLCGWAMATHPADRRRPEWPPHPDRVFQALAAAHFQTDGGSDEYEALKSLAALPAPAISASAHHEREAVIAFVPVNGDKADQISKDGSPLLPHAWAIKRSRQPRTFPVAIPERDVAYLIWREAELLPETSRALVGLCRKVAAVGHSASLVQMWVEEVPPLEPEYVPDDRPGAPLRLRVPHDGRLEELPDPDQTGLRPSLSGWRGYRGRETSPAEPETPGSAFAPDLVVLRRISGRPLGLESTLQLTETLRRAVIKHCPEPEPEWVSGHVGRDGPPSRRTHLAFLPLPDVDHKHAEGRLLGLALALPAEGIPEEDQIRCLSPILYGTDGLPVRLELRSAKSRGAIDGVVDWDLVLEDRESRPVALRSEIWAATGRLGPTDRWASVTPVVLDRYPKAPGDAEETIRRACLNVGLPEPVEVVATPSPPFIGVPHARRFPPLAYGPKGGKRFHTHALIRFPIAVCGPILIGAGRYRGYGLCRPWREEEAG